MDIAHVASALCASPTGSAFLLVVEENDLAPDVAADPATAIHIAALAISQVDVWSSDHQAVIAKALELGATRTALAREILSQPAAQWWFAPVDRQAQWCILRPADDLRAIETCASRPTVTSWELYAQKPECAIYSSTVIGDTCSILAAIEHRAGDYYPDPPIGRVLLDASPAARVFEVNGPSDWHWLAARYPAIDEHGRLVPDWVRVKDEWDAVHLTLAGLLTAEQVTTTTAAGWTELQAWHAEQTAWLHWSFDRVERLPDLAQPPPPPVPIDISVQLAFPHRGDSTLQPEIWTPRR